MATDAQVWRIQRDARELGLTKQELGDRVEKILGYYSEDLTKLSTKQASDLIETLIDEY